MKKTVLLSSILTIALCLCLLVGSTYAFFTSDAEVDIAVTAGKVDVVAAIDAESLSGLSIDVPATKEDDTVYFANGGTATVSGAELTVSRMTPGDAVELDVTATNNSDIAIKYRYVVKCTEDEGLMSALTVKVNGQVCALVDENSDGLYDYFASAWTSPDAVTGIADVTVSVGMDKSVGNTDAAGESYHEKSATVTVLLEAIQANGVDENGNLVQ